VIDQEVPACPDAIAEDNSAASLEGEGVTSMLQLSQLRREDGQTMAEYGVVLAVITAAALGALTVLSTNVGGALVRVGGLVGVGNG
jgi:Flp pilus assembly pilin Flp